MSARDLAMRALIVKHVTDVAAAAIRDRRDDLASVMANGDRVTVTAPDAPDVELGQVWRTKPKGQAAVTDRVAFTAWMAEHYPATVDVADQRAGDWDEVVAVLREHAPHLLTTSTVVHAWAEKEVLALTEKAKRACGPGGEADIPGVIYEPPGAGVVTVRLSPDGPAAIKQLWVEGRIDLHTGEVLALPAGDTPEGHRRRAERLLSEASFRAGGPDGRPVRRDGSAFEPGGREALLTQAQAHLDAAGES